LDVYVHKNLYGVSRYVTWTFAKGESKGQDGSAPSGWSKGEKKGWKTDVPSGLDEKNKTRNPSGLTQEKE
jgi:hypothetical protein